MNAKAIVFRAANRPTLEELLVPEPVGNELLIRIAYSGVSIGTESSIFSGERTHNGTFPLVGGYMASGTVEQAGPDAQGFAVGDQVICMGPRLGGDIACVWGGHTSVQVVVASRCTQIPAGVDMRHAAMHVMPGVGLNAANMAGIAMEDTVLIQGQGLIGQLCGQWCRNRGAKVVTIEPDAGRRALSARHVTDAVIDPLSEDVPERVAALCGPGGPTVVVEATASAKLIGNATRFLKRGGKMIFLSWYPGEITIDFAHFHNNQITAFFPTGNGGTPATRATLQALSQGGISMDGNITDVYPCEQAWEGYQRIIDGDRTIMGMVIDWQ